MASAPLSWSPASNAVTQDVQYKRSIDAQWSTFVNVGPLIGTATITGLLDNVLYEFRILTNCTHGGAVPSFLKEAVKITCPSVTITQSFDSLSYSFAKAGESVSSYTVELLNGEGTSILGTQQQTGSTASISGTFSGLIPNTVYNIRVTPKVLGSQATYTGTCSNASTSTSALPVCGAVTNIQATIN